MLSTARRLYEQGVDVVVGIVETHGRAETETLVAGLECLPRKALTVRGRQLTEFDLDAALARRPALVLVDELAHSNVEGSRHPKRWQDIEELLAAGIDVYSTVNVQHLDTLNDVVSGITGIRVWETVPDRIFDRADEVVLVDLTPDELLQRLKQGKVYLAHQAERAIRNFFRKGNLIALRELALRRTADRVDVEMLQYRRDRSVASVWQTRDSLLACIGLGKDGDRIVRSAARLASRLEVPWHAIHVETPRRFELPASRRQASAQRVLQQLQLAQSLGAETAMLAGEDAAAVAIKYARDHNLSRLVVGRRMDAGAAGWLTPGLAQWLPRGRTFADRLAGAAPDLEVTTVTEFGRERNQAAPETSVEDGGATDWKAYGWSAVYCAVASLIAAPLYSVFALPNIVMLFLLAVVLVAVRFGRGPAVFASFLNVAAFDFFYVPPRFSFAVSDAQYLLTFAVMLTVALIAGQLTAGLRYQAEVATGRASRVRALYEMARDLSGALLPEQIAEICDRFINAEFGTRSVLLLLNEQQRVLPPPADVAGTDAPSVDLGIAQWAADHGEAAGPGTNTLPAGPLLYLPLRAPMRLRGLLAIVATPSLRLLGPEQARLLDTVTRLIAIALERVHYVDVAQQTTLQMESERLRNSLLAAISHDLRTPLTALVGLADSLRLTQPSLSPQQDAIAGDVQEQAKHLRSLVENLLDMARLQSGRVALNRQWNSLEELVGVCLRAMAPVLGRRQVRVHLPPDFPLVEFDAALMERVLCNLLENAAKFTPPGAHVDIGATVQDGRLVMWIDDDGPGLPPGREEEIFEKFERGDKESATPGVGLGLAICRAILQAHDGSIRAENRPGGGARFLLELPAGTPPAPSPDESDAQIVPAAGAPASRQTQAHEEAGS
jgi:two-component system sensor histidine kinase KdpD